MKKKDYSNNLKRCQWIKKMEIKMILMIRRMNVQLRKKEMILIIKSMKTLMVLQLYYQIRGK
jgi:hypothetical protein